MDGKLIKLFFFLIDVYKAYFTYYSNADIYMNDEMLFVHGRLAFIARTHLEVTFVVRIWNVIHKITFTLVHFPVIKSGFWGFFCFFQEGGGGGGGGTCVCVCVN